MGSPSSVSDERSLPATPVCSRSDVTRKRSAGESGAAVARITCCTARGCAGGERGMVDVSAWKDG
jgi:hypothetical protein